MIYRLLDVLIGNLLLDEAKKMPLCKGCRVRMKETGTPYLFLLPVFHDEEYSVSADYYVKNCIPVSNADEIPTGQRACRLRTAECPKCSRRKILVQDFLRVRDQEVIEHRSSYDYRELEPLFWKE